MRCKRPSPARAIRPALLAASIGAVVAAGCQAHVDVKGREILRVAPLRGEPALPEAASAAPPRLDAGTDALTDEELAQVQRDVGARFAAAVEEHAAAGPSSRAPLGEARLLSCRLRAGPGRVHTVYSARCRAALVEDGVVLVEVEADAVRRRRSRGVTPSQAEAIARQERNPLLDVEDSRAALEEAAAAAARLLVHGELPVTDDAQQEPAAKLPDDELRRLALLRLQRASAAADQAAAAVDLGRAGRPEDAKLLVPLLQHDDALVRRATASALGQLLHEDSIAPLRERLADPDPMVRRFVELALQRLYALFPDRRAAAFFFGGASDAPSRTASSNAGS